MSARNAGGKAGTGVFFPVALQASLSSSNDSEAAGLPSPPNTQPPVQGSDSPTVCTDKRSKLDSCTVGNPGGIAARGPADVTRVNALSNSSCTSKGVDTGCHWQHPMPYAHEVGTAERDQHRPPCGRFSSDFPRTKCKATVQGRLVQQAVLPSKAATWPRGNFCSSLSAPSSPSNGAAACDGGMHKVCCEQDNMGANTNCLDLQSLLSAQPHATALAASISQNILLAQHSWQQHERKWSASHAERAVFLPLERSLLQNVGEGLLPLSTSAGSCSSAPFSQHLPSNGAPNSAGDRWLLPQLAAVPAATTLPDNDCRKGASFSPLPSCTALPQDTLGSRTYSVPLPDADNPQQTSSDSCANLLAAALSFECDLGVTTAGLQDDALAAEVDAALHRLLVMRSQLASKKAEAATVAPTTDAASSAIFPGTLSSPSAAVGVDAMSPTCTLVPQMYLQRCSVPFVQSSTLYNSGGFQSGFPVQSMGANVCVPKAYQPVFLTDAAPVAFRDQIPLSMDETFARRMTKEPVGSTLRAGVLPYNLLMDEPLQREMTLADVLANSTGETAARMPVPAVSQVDQLQLLTMQQLGAAAAAAELAVAGRPMAPFDVILPNPFLQ